jgi:hypothetical protein
MNLDLRNDGELLQQFIATQKQALFEALVPRHDPLVSSASSPELLLGWAQWP